jgi:hypothetical protein
MLLVGVLESSQYCSDGQRRARIAPSAVALSPAFRCIRAPVASGDHLAAARLVAYFDHPCRRVRAPDRTPRTVCAKHRTGGAGVLARAVQTKKVLSKCSQTRASDRSKSIEVGRRGLYTVDGVEGR